MQEVAFGKLGYAKSANQNFCFFDKKFKNQIEKFLNKVEITCRLARPNARTPAEVKNTKAGQDDERRNKRESCFGNMHGGKTVSTTALGSQLLK